MEARGLGRTRRKARLAHAETLGARGRSPDECHLGLRHAEVLGEQFGDRLVRLTLGGGLAHVDGDGTSGPVSTSGPLRLLGFAVTITCFAICSSPRCRCARMLSAPLSVHISHQCTSHVSANPASGYPLEDPSAATDLQPPSPRPLHSALCRVPAAPMPSVPARDTATTARPNTPR